MAQAPLARTLRLTGAVAYNAFQDHAGDHAGGRPGEPHRRHARRAGDAGPAHAVRHQPRLFAAAFGLPESARRLPARRQVNTSARRISTRTTPSPRPTSSRRNRPAPRRRPICNPATDAIRILGISNPDRSVSKPPSAEVAAAGAAGGRSGRAAVFARDNCCRPAERSASRFRT